MTYDLNGNILSLKRNGEKETEQFVIMIDDLDYEYDGNRLINVADATAHTDGFNDGNDPQQSRLDDFEYDDYGNMIVDRNKKITNITYNHLNLPKKITFENNQSIEYIYGADGSKLRKTVTEGSSNKNTDYLNGFQYTNEILEFFPTAEGYVTVNTNQLSDHYNYVFNYTDHLGNIRLKYTAHPQTGEPQSLEENHYYPFGLTHDGYQPHHDIIGLEGANVTIIPTSTNVGDPYKYKFGGKEYQEEFDINTYDFGARNYDPALGRWMNVDPLAEQFVGWSPYSYTFNNPINWTDPTGMAPEDWVLGKNGSIYWDKNATSQETTKTGDTYLGRDLTFEFNSYIDKGLWDGPNPPFDVSGEKLISKINVFSNTDADNNLLSVDIISEKPFINKTGGIFQGRDYFPGQSNKSVNEVGMTSGSVTYEQHAMVHGLEKIGLNLGGYDAVNVAQKLTLGLSGNNLSVSASTDIFPSARLSVNDHQLFNYTQPSFKATHSILKTQTGVRIPRNSMNDGFIPVYQYNHSRPAPAFYNRYNN